MWIAERNFASRVLAVIALGLVALSASACPGSPHVPSRQEALDREYANLQTAVASVSRAQYHVYWLGPRVELPGGTSLVPGAAEFGDDADAEHLSYSYDSQQPLGPSVRFDVYAPARWQNVRAQRLQRPSDPLHIDKTTIAGRPAEVWVSSTSRTPVNHIDVVVDYGDTVVVAGTTALPQYDRTPEFNVPLNTYIARMNTPSPTPLPDLNPLIDEQTFLGVLQQLRPYPQ